MSEAKPNIVWRFLRGIWYTLEGSRRAFFNLIWLVILIAIGVALFSGGVKVTPKSALVVWPKGVIVEQFTGDPIERAIAKAMGDEIPEVQLRDLLKAIELAKTDKNIEHMVLITDSIASVGYAQLRDIGAALKSFKESGKEIIAYADFMDQKNYYLAAHANKIYMHPEGGVMLEGVGRSRTYFKNALDKLGIEARLFRVGEFKSAGEPYIRNDASPEAIEADLHWMNDIWSRYLNDIAELRGVTASDLSADIEQLVEQVNAANGDIAKLAIDSKLVDELVTRDELRALLIEKGEEDPDTKSFRQISFDSYLAIYQRSQLPIPQAGVAVVIAEGEIVDGKQPAGVIGGESTAKLIRQAREDENTKALVLRVNSPGGGVFPSELIRREVELTKAAGIPIVVSMGNLAASGGYWISMNADEIIASPSTITGSIGIFGLWFNIPQTMEKLGLNSDGASTTWLTNAFDPTRPYDERVGQVIQPIIDRGYQQFIGKVAEARDTTADKIDSIARGRVWSGQQARAHGLVDKLGTYQDALDAAAKLADLGDKYKVNYIAPEMSPFEKFMSNTSSSALAKLIATSGISVPAALLPAQTAREIQQLHRLLQDQKARKPIAVYAHCECDAL